MSQPLHQIHVDFSPEEDRLQLCISTSTHEMHFWLTRRFVKLLWPGLRNAIEVTAKLVTDAHVDPISKAPMHDAMQKQTPSQPTTNPLAANAKETPLGPLPVLVTRARLDPIPDGRYLVGLNPQQSNGIEMVMESRHLLALSRLLSDAVAKTDWDLSLSLPSGNQASNHGSGVLCQVESNYKFN